MFPQPLIGALIIIGMFVLRLGLPLAIILVIGGWLEKRLAPPAEDESERRTQGARIIPFRPRQIRSKPASKDETAKRTNVR